MKNIGLVSYNINCNFTNYGSALQSWALSTTIGRMGYRPILVDYCPKAHLKSDPLNPFGNMWDNDLESRRMCELTMPSIRVNYSKFEKFYTERFNRTAKKYTADNFDEIVTDEDVERFVCGSDTIFCIDEFKCLEEAYWANCKCMRGRSVAYAASFGDSHFTIQTYSQLNERLLNFKAIGLRENLWIPYCREHVANPVQKVTDPTLLLTHDDYERITVTGRQCQEPYLLLYARRYNREMEAYAVDLARRKGWKIVEITLRAINAEKGHVMRYDAGVEEFLALVRDAEYVVTNSFHGLIFSVQYSRPFIVFSREQADSKIEEVLDLFGLRKRLIKHRAEASEDDIEYGDVHTRISSARAESLAFLRQELEML